MTPAPAPLAISIGDPAGVSPEIIVRCWAERDSDIAPFACIGGAGVLREAGQRIGAGIRVERVDSLTQVLTTFDRCLPVLTSEDAPYAPGTPSEAGARLALRSLEHAITLALDGSVAGVVTAPVAKAQLAAAGFAFPGQTELLAERCGVAADDAVMMLAGPSLRTVPLTVHCALAEVPARLSADLICRRTRIVAKALRDDFGIEDPRIAIAALNPHAGEGKRFGAEEADIIGPAIAILRAQGLDVTGPHPADALFAPRARAGYDAAVCMYHDQALIPVKALDFDQGVNVTLGLPIVRTSPDHGTAFDIAGVVLPTRAR